MLLDLADDDTLPSRPQLELPSVTATDFGGSTSCGHRRTENQDRWGEASGLRFVVADGMGGYKGGAEAATWAVSEFLAAPSGLGWDTALRTINTAVRHAMLDQNFGDAGTTLVGLVIDSDQLTVVAIGDSRAYRLRSRQLECLTKDHNLGNLRASGVEHELHGPDRALTSYLGSPNNAQQIDITTCTVVNRERFLLCSDGVSLQLAPETLRQVLTDSSTCQQAADALVQASDAVGGRDNATALVVDLQS